MEMRRTTIGALLLAAVLALLATPAIADVGVKANVYRFSDGSQVIGAWSSLATSSSGAKMTLQTSGLPAGHTVSVWWVIFNEPQNCTHGEAGLRCGAGDLPPFGGDDSAVTSVLYAAGREIGDSGLATFSARLATGVSSGAAFGPGLVNPLGADIHLLVVDNGVLTPQQRAEGVQDFGPCSATCVVLQFSPHEQ
jgi:hypothetical protein